jgi:hypothetical protein
LTVIFSRLIVESFNHLFILHHILYDEALAGGEISLSFFELKTRHFHHNPGPILAQNKKTLTNGLVSV